MPTILAIDAAWTTTEPSGVAVVRSEESGWRYVAAAPSYDEFLALARGWSIDWDLPTFHGGVPDVVKLLAAAQQLAGCTIDIITIDMPVATVSISCRRRADDAISTEFGACWCSAHSPNQKRPGPLGAALSNAFGAAGYPLATVGTSVAGAPCMLEVYPHPALLSLLKRSRRIPYKVSKSRDYWPSFTLLQRIQALLTEFVAIHSALAAAFGPLNIPIPAEGSVQKLVYLKRYEDALDALVCAWVGMEFLAGRTVALGDDTAAIWCPRDVVFSYPKKAG